MLRTWTLILCLYPLWGSADVVGWHWYNQPDPVVQHKLKVFNALDPERQLKVLQQATNRLKDQAVLTGKVSDITAYKQAQDFWMKKATQFTVSWERMLLMHPELNYALQHSHENALAPIDQQNKHQREDQSIQKISETKGLLLFYRGTSPADKLFAHNIAQYSRQYHLALIKSDVAKDNQQAHALGINYYPALLLVDPKHGSTQVASYGFKSNNEISDRLLKLSDQWNPEF